MRNREIKVRVSDDELKQIKENAGKNVATFMRELSLMNKAPQVEVVKEIPIFEAQDPILLREIASIGSLLNQAMRVAHTEVKGGKPLNSVRLAVQIEAIRVLLSELKNAR